MSNCFTISRSIWFILSFLWRWGLMAIALTTPKPMRTGSVSFSRCRREDNVWKQTTVKFRGACFLAPGWDATSSPCAGKETVCLLDITILKGSSWTVQKWPVISPEMQPQSCLKVMKKWLIPTAEISKTSTSTPGNSWGFTLSDKPSQEHVHLLLFNWTVLNLLHGTKKIYMWKRKIHWTKNGLLFLLGLLFDIETYLPVEIAIGFIPRLFYIRTSKKILDINPIDAPWTW